MKREKPGTVEAKVCLVFCGWLDPPAVKFPALTVHLVACFISWIPRVLCTYA